MLECCTVVNWLYFGAQNVFCDVFFYLSIPFYSVDSDLGYHLNFVFLPFFCPFISGISHSCSTCPVVICIPTQITRFKTQNSSNQTQVTVADNQSPPVLEICFWHWKKCPKRSETAEMDPFNVKEKIGMSQSLKKAIFSFFDPQNLAVPLNNSLKIPKNVQSTPF